MVDKRSVRKTKTGKSTNRRDEHIEYCSDVFAKRRPSQDGGSVILLHEGLWLFPRLHAMLLKHERDHVAGRRTMEDNLLDLKSMNILCPELFGFFRTFPLALFYALSPISFDRVYREWYYDSFLLMCWFFMFLLISSVVAWFLLVTG